MFISIIIPVYNVERYIKDCLKVLFAMDYAKEEYEVICVDNGSTDASVDIIRRYPRVILLSEAKRGAYAARNLGISRARGEVIAFIDPDCIPSINWLKRIAEAMEASETKVVLGYRSSASGSYMLGLTDIYENTKKEFVLSQDKPELFFGYTNNMAVRSELFHEIGPFEEIARGADTVFVSRIVHELSCSAVSYSPEVRIRHMEMNSILDYYRKSFVFGKSSKHYSKIVNNRPLNIRENLMIFHKTTRLHRFKYYKSVSLFFLLIVGKAFWTIGRCSGE